MKLFINSYLSISFDAVSNICTATWTAETENATIKDFREWNQTLVAYVAHRRPYALLADTQNYLFAITPSLQEWAVEHIFQCFEDAGLQKLAIITPKNLVVQIALEQFVYEYQNPKIQIQFFADLENASTWLKE